VLALALVLVTAPPQSPLVLLQAEVTATAITGNRETRQHHQQQEEHEEQLTEIHEIQTEIN
jgi:hypothetical protein